MYCDISEEWKEQCEKIKYMSYPLNANGFGVEKLERCLPT